MAATANVPPASGRAWLASAPIDALLLIATPLFLIPIFTVAENLWSAEAIIVAVTLFGANAHHLPGFMRAYGDPAFRQRYGLRLTIAPIAIIGVCLAFFHLRLSGLLFVVFTWGIWHALAQVYGLGRMYDGRASLVSPKTARLDKALCIGWFGGGFLFSQHRIGLALGELYRAGIPAIPAEWLVTARWSWLAGTLALTCVWGWNQLALSRAGLGNPIKIALFASSFAFWWYANIPIESAVVGVVLFEAFHDVQYLTTVWLYNRRLVDKGQRLGPFSTVLFRPGAIGLVIYIGLCWLYGGSSVLGKQVFGDAATSTIGALVLSSLILHFYYDSFLWNVRDPGVRADFGLKTGEQDDQNLTASPQTPAPGTLPTPTGSSSSLSSTFPSGFKWPGLAWAWFVLPLLVLLASQFSIDEGDMDWRRKWATSLPDYEGAQLKLGELEFERGRPALAVAAFERAVETNPRSREGLRQLVEAYARTGRRAEASDAFSQLDEIGGVDARSLVGLAMLAHQEDPDAAERFYLRALDLDASNFEARMNLAALLAGRGKMEAARIQLVAAHAIAPQNAGAAFNLGQIEFSLGHFEEAAHAFRAVLDLEPTNEGAKRGLAQSLARMRPGRTK